MTSKTLLKLLTGRRFNCVWFSVNVVRTSLSSVGSVEL